MARRLAFGLDVGTSGLKALAVDDLGRVVAEAEREYPLLTPQPGWTEQRPEDWWQAACEALRELATRCAGDEILALGLSGQMHGMVPLDAQGEVVRPAILWNDQRTGDAVEAIEQAVPRRDLIERTGNPAITGFQLAKVVWLREHERESFERTRAVLFPKDYLAFRLTGEQAAEPTDASGSNAFNVHALSWDADIIGAVGLDPDLWPTVVPSKAVVGHVEERLAGSLGLPAGLPVVAGAGDNAAAGYGLGLSRARPERGSVSLGTSGVLFAPIPDPTPDPEGRVHLFCHADGGFHLLGVTLAAAGSLPGFRDTFAPGRSFEEMVQLAAGSVPGAGGVTFKPYLAGERTPHLDPRLRGSFHGLSLATRLEDVVRSVLEGVAFSLRDAFEVMPATAVLEEALATGGGARSDVWLQIVADVLGLRLGRPASNHGAAYGAALLALETGGVEATRSEGVESWVEPGPFDPYVDSYTRYRKLGPPID